MPGHEEGAPVRQGLVSQSPVKTDEVATQHRLGIRIDAEQDPVDRAERYRWLGGGRCVLLDRDSLTLEASDFGCPAAPFPVATETRSAFANEVDRRWRQPGGDQEAEKVRLVEEVAPLGWVVGSIGRREGDRIQERIDRERVADVRSGAGAQADITDARTVELTRPSDDDIGGVGRVPGFFGDLEGQGAPLDGLPVGGQLGLVAQVTDVGRE